MDILLLPRLLIIISLIVASKSQSDRKIIAVIKEDYIDWARDGQEKCDAKLAKSNQFKIKLYADVNISTPVQVFSTPNKSLDIYTTDARIFFVSNNNDKDSFLTKKDGWLTTFTTEVGSFNFVCNQNNISCTSYSPIYDEVDRDLSSNSSYVTYPINPGNSFYGNYSILMARMLDILSFVSSNGSEYEYLGRRGNISNILYHFQVNSLIGTVSVDENRVTVKIIYPESDPLINTLNYTNIVSAYYQQSKDRLYIIFKDDGVSKYGWIHPFRDSKDFEEVDNLGFDCNFDQFMVIGDNIFIFRVGNDILSVQDEQVSNVYEDANNNMNFTSTYIIPSSYEDSMTDAVIFYSNGKYYQVNYKVSEISDVSIVVVIALAAILFIMVFIVVVLAVVMRRRNQRSEDEEGLIGGDDNISDGNVQETITSWTDRLEPRRSIVISTGDDDSDDDGNNYKKLVEIADQDVKNYAVEAEVLKEPETEASQVLDDVFVDEVFDQKEDENVDHVLNEDNFDAVEEPFDAKVEEIVIHEEANGNEVEEKVGDLNDKIVEVVHKEKVEEVIERKEEELEVAVKLNEEVEGMLKAEKSEDLDPYIPDILANIKGGDTVQVNYMVHEDAVENIIPGQGKVVVEHDENENPVGMKDAEIHQNSEAEVEKLDDQEDETSIYEEANQEEDSSAVDTDTKDDVSTKSVSVYASADTLIMSDEPSVTVDDGNKVLEQELCDEEKNEIETPKDDEQLDVEMDIKDGGSKQEAEDPKDESDDEKASEAGAQPQPVAGGKKNRKKGKKKRKQLVL